MAVPGENRTFALSKNRKFQKLKDNKPSRRAARQHTWRAFSILGGSGVFVRDRLFLGLCAYSGGYPFSISGDIRSVPS